MEWQTAELKGYAYFAERGYRIFVPLVCNEGFDFVVEKDGTFLRINVKVAGLKDRRRNASWSISLASGSGSPTRSGVVDIFLVWLPSSHRFIELPGDFFVGTVSKSRLIPARHIHN